MARGTGVDKHERVTARVIAQIHTISILLHWNEENGPPLTTSTTAEATGPVPHATTTAAQLDADTKYPAGLVVDPQALDSMEVYDEQSLSAAQRVRNVSRGGIGLLRLNSAIEYDAAAKGQDGRNGLITASNDYCKELLFVAEKMKNVGRGADFLFKLAAEILDEAAEGAAVV
jgi:hypothetical protein